MPTSVSSERAFSQGGITIRDQCTRLKADVVEALQFLKCTLRDDLLMQGSIPSSKDEAELELEEEYELEGTTIDAGSEGQKQLSWDIILDEDDDDLYYETDNDFDFEY